MTRKFERSGILAAACAAVVAGPLGGCAPAEPVPNGTGGGSAAGSVTGAGGAANAAGSGGLGLAAGGMAGTTGTAGMGAAGAVVTTGGAPGDAAAGDGGSSQPVDPAGRTKPTCATPKSSPVGPPNGKPTNECDYLLQSVDFEDKWSYSTPASSIRVTTFGTALGLFEINNCSPYCFSKALTIGVDIVGGGDPKQLQGEVIVRLPATGPGLPITTAIGRDSLAWIQLEGATAPPFKIVAQMVIENATGVIAGTESKQIGYANWLGYQQAEFKYFPVKDTTFSAAPVNVTGIGFRITAPANLAKGQEWHGTLIIDHLQIRSSSEPKDPAGTYPFGL